MDDFVDATLARVTETVLDNGLRVLVYPRPDVRTVDVRLGYGVGSDDSPPGLSGLAHWLEHLVFRLRTVRGDSRDDRFRSMGASANAWTSHVMTVYTTTVEKTALPDVLAVEASCMAGLVFDADECEIERDVVAAERVQIVESDPEYVHDELLMRVLFGDHPSGRPVIGTSDDIARYRPEAAEVFHRTWYRPANAVLTIAGDVDVDETVRLVERAFADVEATDVPARSRPEWEPTGRADVLVRSRRVETATVDVLFPLRSSEWGGPEARARLDLLAFALRARYGPIERRFASDDIAVPTMSRSAGIRLVGPDWTVFRLTVEPSFREGRDAARYVEEVLADPESWTRDDMGGSLKGSFVTHIGHVFADPGRAASELVRAVLRWGSLDGYRRYVEHGRAIADDFDTATVLNEIADPERIVVGVLEPTAGRWEIDR